MAAKRDISHLPVDEQAKVLAARERTRQWKLANPERAKASKKEWATANKGRVNARTRELHAANPERQRRNYKRHISADPAGHREKRRVYEADYRKENPDKLAKNQKAWHDKNPNYREKREALDPQFKLANALRNRMHQAVRKNYKAGSAVADLGCSIAFLKAHLESQFRPGMMWANHTTHGWHIDHIKPLSNFDLTDRAQFLAACHYTNLQPLWAVDNLSKGARTEVVAT